MFYASADRDRTKLTRDPFKAIVAPRPIGWISTRALDGRVNLAPYSFFNGFCSAPPIVGSPARVGKIRRLSPRKAESSSPTLRHTSCAAR